MSDARSEVGGDPPWTAGPWPSKAGGPAPLLVRLAARFLDQFVHGVPVVVVVLPLLFLWPEVDWILLIPLAAFAYFTIMEAKTGSTVGKRVCGLRVFGGDGAAPSVAAAAKRNAWLLIGYVPVVGVPLYFVALVAIAATIHLRDGRRGLHDQFAGTSVVFG